MFVSLYILCLAVLQSYGIQKTHLPIPRFPNIDINEAYLEDNVTLVITNRSENHSDDGRKWMHLFTRDWNTIMYEIIQCPNDTKREGAVVNWKSDRKFDPRITCVNKTALHIKNVTQNDYGFYYKVKSRDNRNDDGVYDNLKDHNKYVSGRPMAVLVVWNNTWKEEQERLEKERHQQWLETMANEVRELKKVWENHRPNYGRF